METQAVARVPTAEIRALAGLLDELDYYQLLEVEPGAQGSQIKRAYYQASRRFHPDAHPDLTGDDKASVNRVSKRVTEAYQVLRDPRRRRAYDAQRQEGDGNIRLQLVDADARAGQQAQAEHQGQTPHGRRFFTQARQDLDRGDRAAAIRNLKMALTFEPKNEHFQRKLEELRS